MKISKIGIDDFVLNLANHKFVQEICKKVMKQKLMIKLEIQL